MNEKPVALVTGASRGIGRAIALELAQLGYDLTITNSAKPGSADKARQTKQDIESLNSSCAVFAGDIADSTARGALVDFVRTRFGRCDMLVNNAGMAPPQRSDLLQADEKSYDRVMDVNLKGPFFLTQLIANWMIQQMQTHTGQKCRIVNISSISAYASSPDRSQYCISKAGLSMMTMLYADRLAQHGIGVFEIRPGIIKTDMTSPVSQKYDKLIEQGLTPIKRWGSGEDVAHAVAAVAQGSLDFCTGQVINADGGFHLRRL